MMETRSRIFIFPCDAATRPALNRIESPGKKNPKSNPVSIKTIAPTTR